MLKKYNSIFQIFDTCERCSKNCKTEGIGEMIFCPSYSRIRTEISSIAKITSIAAGLLLFMGIGLASAEEWNPSMWLLSNPPQRHGMQAQVNPIPISIPDEKALTEKECIPSPWVLTNPKTGERSGVVLDTLFTPGDDKGAGTCMYRVRFGDSEQWMVTFSQTERLKRQSEGK